MSQKVKGNLRGLPPSDLKRVTKLYDRRLVKETLVSLDFAREVYTTARTLNRMVGALITREGHIAEVVVGTREIIYLPDLGRYRLGEGRLRRLRLVFSDLSNDLELVKIPADIITDLEKLRLDAVVGVKEQRNRVLAAYAYNRPGLRLDELRVEIEQLGDLGRSKLDFAAFIADLDRQQADQIPSRSPEGLRSVLIGVYDRSGRRAQESLAELKELAHSAGLNVVDTLVQTRRPDPKTLLGKGKLEEALLTCLRVGAEVVVFDAELKPFQWRIITNSTELKVLDRSMLILDIFAQRATSADGRLQVELAQLKYNLPRLVEKDTGLSRLTGGIGGRGPGETKLEIGRRRIRERIRRLEQQISNLQGHRQQRRERRHKNQLPLVSLLGYTNAGKSTLFNALSRSSVTVADKLFSTLDPAQRRLFVGTQEEAAAKPQPNVVLSDTVGFIHELPKELVNAFRATLEELHDAVLLVQVLDVSDPQCAARKAAVETILAEWGLGSVRRLLVLNKIDLLAPEDLAAAVRNFGGITVAALTGRGLAELMAVIRCELQPFLVGARADY